MSKAIYRAIIAWLLLAACFYSMEVAQAQIAPGVQQSAAQTATITGNVIQSDGTPVASADVRLAGSNAHLTTVSDAHGTFSFTSVPYGTYRIDAVGANLGTVSRAGIMVKGDINVTIQYVAQTSGLKEIARVSTSSAGAQINVTAASIASVTPTQYAFQGNLSWQQLLEQIPGVTIGGGLNSGNSTSATIPGNPFQPIVLSINGALPYETSTTMDGMPLSNYTFSSEPSAGVNLSVLPMPLFETADVVRGPGANAPSVVDSVGGSFVLHAPGTVEKNSFEASFSNDAYGGYFANMKATFLVGKLSGTVVYGFDNSPGPLGNGPFFFGFPSDIGIGWVINGNVAASGGFLGYGPGTYSAYCNCYSQESLVGYGSHQSTAWSQHNGGIGLAYQMTPSITAQMFYAGSQSTTDQAFGNGTFLFTPGASYAGSLVPGSYTGLPFECLDYERPILQSGSLLEEKVTAYLGRGVLRLAALQNYSAYHQFYPAFQSTTAQLYGTGTYCANPACTATTPFVFTGQTATLTFPAITAFHYIDGGDSTNDDLLASYEMQLGPKFNLGISFVKSVTGSSNFYDRLECYLGTNYSSSGGDPAVVTETTDEFRLHAGMQLSDTLALDGSYYITRGDYHVPNPNNPSQWVDSIFPYSAPRLGVTWRISRDAVVRAAAGGGFALPPVYSLVGSNALPSCDLTAGQCFETVTNTNLQPEKSFGFDIGTDVRLRRDTVLTADVYRTDLYGQLFQSVNLVGVDTDFNLPLYAQECVNIAHSRFEGINLSLRHDVPHGLYWHAGLGLTRGYIISVPPGFYNTAGETCDLATGVGCQNTYALPNANFDGEFQSTIPYANGGAALGYRWAAKKYLDIQANYQGNNNAYFQPAFLEFDAHASYPLAKNFALLATLTNITGVHDQNFMTYAFNPSLVAPTIAGHEFPLNPIPYGPRTLIVTANIQL